ncbi:uncharacterized protein [Dysidea avara]|uniref:uncharacterized protein n=1 Tax=Dysidea avara TaxID=196820 RepID=UPI00331A039C
MELMSPLRSIIFNNVVVYVKDWIVWGCGELRDHYETKRRENVYTIGGVEERSLSLPDLFDESTDSEQVEVTFSLEEQLERRFTVIQTTNSRKTDTQHKANTCYCSIKTLDEGSEVQEWRVELDDSLEVVPPNNSVTSSDNTKTSDSMADCLSVSVSPTVVPSESVTTYSLTETRRVTVSHKFHLYCQPTLPIPS